MTVHRAGIDAGSANLACRTMYPQTTISVIDMTWARIPTPHPVTILTLPEMCEPLRDAL